MLFTAKENDNNFEKMVGAVRFELTTSCTRNKRATRLRYAPTLGAKRCRDLHAFANQIVNKREMAVDLDPLFGNFNTLLMGFLHEDTFTESES